MGETRTSLIRKVYKSWSARLLTGVPIVAGLYQFGCDQFGLPTLPDLWGLTRAAVPWWAWIFLAQGGAVYGLFEFVRVTSARSAFTPHTAEAVAVDTKRAEPVNIVEPDVTLLEIGKRVVCALGDDDDKPSTDAIRRANLEIGDKVNSRELRVWARFHDFPMEQFGPDELRNARFNFVRNEVTVPTEWKSNTYSDVMFLETEVSELWPPIR